MINLLFNPQAQWEILNSVVSPRVESEDQETCADSMTAITIIASTVLASLSLGLTVLAYRKFKVQKEELEQPQTLNEYLTRMNQDLKQDVHNVLTESEKRITQRLQGLYEIKNSS